MASKKQYSTAVCGLVIRCKVCGIEYPVCEIGNHIQTMLSGEETEGEPPPLMIKCACGSLYPVEMINSLVTKRSPDLDSGYADQGDNGSVIQTRKSSKAKISAATARGSDKRSVSDMVTVATTAKKQRKLVSTHEEADSQATPALPRGQVQLNNALTETIQAARYSPGAWKKLDAKVAEKFVQLHKTDPRGAYECFVEEMKKIYGVEVWTKRSEPVFNALMTKLREDESNEE